MANEVLGTDVVVQIGIIVKDIEKVVEEYAKIFGVEKPEITITDMYEKAHTEYKGEPTNARAKLAFFRNFKNIEIEFIEPDENPSTWREFLETHGEGIHHLGFSIKGTNQVIERFKMQGIDVAQNGDYEGGRYTYLESFGKLKFIIELLENF
ncbi:MAG: VOC family protein [Dictyoglomaceae bacterium]|nr:VOC family protein [Dictyoglomaceae bacterium]HPU43532.1 VOC family protein [Dictyoglomaceae bacterium]